jgi:hypothetical protein
VETWDGLWGLLMALTVYRAARWFRHYNTQSRGLDKESPLVTAEPEGDSDRRSAIAMLESSDPWPDEVAEMLETAREILQPLPESQRRVIELGLLGYDDDAIGEEAGRTRARVVQFREDLIGELEKAFDNLRGSESANAPPGCPRWWAMVPRRCPEVARRALSSGQIAVDDAAFMGLGQGQPAE